MKIVAISDTHTYHEQINLPEGDVIVHAGDATGRGRREETIEFLDWFGSLNYRYKIFVPGNHDFFFETYAREAENLCKKRGILLLNDKGVTLLGVNFWGSPVTPWFCDWAFNRIRGNATEMYCPQTRKTVGGLPIKPHWDKIPKDTNVLITHGPPYGKLDELCHVISGVPKGIFVGCEELEKAVNRIKPAIHIFGHIHRGYGELHENGVSYYNAAMCDEMYHAVNKPHAIEIFAEDLK